MRAILTVSDDLGIAVAGLHGSGAPVVNILEGVVLNGSAAAGEAGDTLILRNDATGTLAPVRSVDTGEHPYDDVVVAVLLAALDHSLITNVVWENSEDCPDGMTEPSLGGALLRDMAGELLAAGN